MRLWWILSLCLLVACCKYSPVVSRAELKEAIRRNDVAKVREYLEKGVPVTWHEHNLASGKYEILQLLLDHGVDPYKDPDEGRPLVCNIADSYPTTKEEEEKFAAVLDRIDWKKAYGLCDEGESLLAYAAASENLFLVKYLIEKGADVNAIGNDPYGIRWSVLMHAASRKNKDIVKMLLDAGADVHYRNPAGETALSIARKMCPDPRIVKLLEEANAKK